MNRIKSIAIFVITAFVVQMVSVKVFAQSVFLEMPVSVHVEQEKLAEALLEIGEAGGFAFSYNSEILPGDSLVSLDAEEKRVDELLKELLRREYRYKAIGNHLIILPSIDAPAQKKEQRRKPLDYIISGYIADSRTGERIREASIYEVEGMKSAITDQEGHYQIQLPAFNEVHYLNFSKVGYLDTVIIVKPADHIPLDVQLTPVPDRLESLAAKPVDPKNIHKRTLVAALVPKKSVIMADNVKVEEERFAQISLLPYIGTNQLVTGLISNKYSINLIAGYSGGVDRLELGGFQNIVRGNVNGVQLAGFGNIVSGDTKGFQGSGFYNVTVGSLTGVQASGFGNVAMDTIRGTQLSGFFNTLRGPMYGVQGSGFLNFTTQHVDGLQATGFANVALKDVRLTQLSGFGNYCRNVDGIQATGFANIATGVVKRAQLSGFANYCRDVDGLQATGFANIATGVNTGLQVSGFINYATELDGYQISVFNVCDTVKSGTPFGVFSFVRRGFHEFELGVNELFWLNASFKTGTHRFYNIFSTGINTNWGYAGYGLGTQFRLGERLSLGIELSSQIISNLAFSELIGNQNRLLASLNIRLAKHLAVVIGPSVNLLVSSPKTGQLDLPLVLFRPFTNQMVGGSNLIAWPGLQFSIRI